MRCKSCAPKTRSCGRRPGTLGRELLDTRARLLAEADQPELQRLRSENESLWAQATSLGQQLLETRSRIEFDRAAQAEEVERLRREHATSDAQLHELGRELLDARQRLEIAETNRTFASAFCRQRP
jgi:hypothetical protein